MTFPAAYKRFLASAPQGDREYRTLEIHHPDFSSTLRFVKDFENQNLTLEATAPRNPGASVLFTAIAMVIEEPNEGENTEPILSVGLGATGNEVQDQIDQITTAGYLIPIEIIYRKYYSGDLTAPVLVIELSASKLDFKGYNGVSFIAEDTDFDNKSSGELYTLERFPTLRGIG